MKKIYDKYMIRKVTTELPHNALIVLYNSSYLSKLH